LKKVWIKGKDDPDFIKIKEIKYFTGSPAQNGLYTETIVYDENADGKYLTMRRFLDGLGRVYREEIDGFIDDKSGNALTQVTEFGYDSAGRLSYKSNPYFSGRESAVYTNYFYDSAGRKIREEFPDQTKIEYRFFSQSGSNTLTAVKTDRKGIESRYEYDSVGRIVSKSDPENAYVSYQYNALGRLTKTRIYDNEKGYLDTIIEYDSLGRKISMTDPNSGIWKYKYDDNSNVTELVDPESQNNPQKSGQKIIYSYDELNRITKKDYPSDQTDIIYEYDDAAVNGKGKLVKVTDSTGISQFSYDGRGNLSNRQKQVNINGVDRVFSFHAEYNIQNKMTRLTYPDGYTARNVYSKMGYLSSVSLLKPGAVFGNLIVDYRGPYSTNEPDKLELIRRTGNGVETSIKFDGRNLLPKNIKTTLADKTSVAEDYELSYDPAGNINIIKDNKTDDGDQSQSFTYDNLHRLLSANSPGLYGQLDFQYSSSGNIKGYGGLNLAYSNTSHPQAVTSDGTNSYEYDYNGNMTRRKGRKLSYDSENRLTQIIGEDNTVKQTYLYDYRGQRTIKKKADGTLVYNLDGKFEILVKPDNSEVYTKYIYGAAGEIAAQITRDNMSVAYFERMNRMVYADLFQTGSPEGILKKMYYLLDKYISDPAFARSFFLALFFLTGTGLLLTIFYFSYFPGQTRTSFHKRHRFMAEIAPVLLVALIFQFAFAGCQKDTSTVATDPWGESVIPESTPDISGLSGTYNDSALNGSPVIGAFFYHPDHLGSVSFITNNTGQVVSRVYYKPYGEVIRKDANGSAVSNGPDIFRHKYTGQEEDAESGLLFYKSRYYDPVIGRFLSLDSEVQDPFSSKSMNRYMYTEGNPVRYRDPGGHFIVPAIFIAMGVGMLVGMAIGATVGALKKEDGGYKSIKDLKWSDYNINKADVRRGMVIGGIIGGFAGAAIYTAFFAAPIAVEGASGIEAFLYSRSVDMAWGSALSYLNHGLQTGDWTSNVAMVAGISGAIGGGLFANPGIDNFNLYIEGFAMEFI
jgi:RHS repeat-associated protein